MKMKTFKFGSINLYLIFFREVKNVEKLLNDILQNKCDPDFAMIRVKYVLDPLQIAVAGGKSVYYKDCSKMVTKNIYTELLYNLSISKNITQSLKSFGVDKDDSSMVLAHFGDDKSVKEVICRIDGEQIGWKELEETFNKEDIMKIYKINKEEYSSMDLLDSVITRISTKNID